MVTAVVELSLVYSVLCVTGHPRGHEVVAGHVAMVLSRCHLVVVDGERSGLALAHCELRVVARVKMVGLVLLLRNLPMVMGDWLR